jgi:TatA/E family protein of Tat protein translocase
VPFDGLFSPLHWLIIATVALLVFGPQELPALARRGAQLVREVQRLRRHLTAELRDAVTGFDRPGQEAPASIDRDEPAETTVDPPQP